MCPPRADTSSSAQEADSSVHSAAATETTSSETPSPSSLLPDSAAMCEAGEGKATGPPGGLDERWLQVLSAVQPRFACNCACSCHATPSRVAATRGAHPAAADTALWLQVRDALVQVAEGGNADVARYGDMFTGLHQPAWRVQARRAPADVLPVPVPGRRYLDMRRGVADAVTCSRFLRGAKGNVGRAVAMFQAHLEWRVRYKLDAIVDEDFADLKAHDELYWGGKDKDGVMTLMWRLRKHDARRTEAKRFVRFFIHQIESGLRTCEHYPNSLFNICVDLDKVGYANTDQEMGIILQSILAKNYPKVRKGLYVFPVNWYATPPPPYARNGAYARPTTWYHSLRCAHIRLRRRFVQLFWDTLLKPLLATLQPDIEDKICPLTGDWKAKLLDRYDVEEIEVGLGGQLDLSARRCLPIRAYCPRPYTQSPSRDGCALSGEAGAAPASVELLDSRDGDGGQREGAAGEEEDEFCTPSASPPTSGTVGLAVSTVAGAADNEELVGDENVRVRQALVTAAVGAGEDMSMTRKSSEVSLGFANKMHACLSLHSCASCVPPCAGVPSRT